jgi:hypothetical protein
MRARLGIFFSILTLLLSGEITFNDVWFTGRHPADGIGRTVGGYGALIAVKTEIVPDLQVERSVPEGGTPLYTFGTANAKLFIDNVLKIGLLDKLPLDGCGGTELVLGTGLQLGSRLEIAATQIAVPAQGVCVDTLHRGFGLHTFGGTPSALGTFKGIDLPYIIFPGSGTLQGKRSSAHHRYTQGKPHPVVDKRPPVVSLILFLHDRE